MKKLALLVAALALFAAACSNDTTIDAAGAEAGAESETPAPSSEEPTAVTDNSEAADTAAAAPENTPEPAAVTAEPEPTAVQADATPTAEPEDEPTSEPAEPTPDAVEAIRAVAEADDWCTAAAAVEEGTLVLDTLNFNDPELLEQGLTQGLAVIGSSKRLVPDEIADDLDQSLEGFNTLVSALEDVDWKFVDLDLSVIEQLNGPMELASYNIELYNFNECGIGTEPDLPTAIADDSTDETPDESTDETADEAPVDPLAFEGTIRDQAVLGLVEAGFSEAEASCIFDNLDFTNPEAMSDVTTLLAVFGDCGISVDRLAQLGQG